VREFARAKLNLYLHVVGRRADGYHLLDSLVAFAEVGDRLSVVPAAELSLKVGGPFAAQLEDDPERNLVLRGARYLAARCNVAQGAALLLEKHLPVASGIGGGSSDAAAALRALAGLWHCDLANLDPSDIARALGADVPACLLNRAAWLGGIGEAVVPAPPLPDCWVVLANPGLALATPAVFKARQGAFSEPARFESVIADASNLAALLSERRNDLAPAALALAPEIEAVLAALAAERGALLARMSGSGATCFALFAVPDAAETAAVRLAAAHPSWWVAQGKLG
jgi:4-diphosphocytidyl-2-C-methyl-D-erythritol kinase